MEFTVRPEVKIFYPTAIFGSLTINNQQNLKKHPDIEQAKRLIEKKIRETYPPPKEDPIIQRYAAYFHRWGKTYPIEYQINSIMKCDSLGRIVAAHHAGEKEAELYGGRRVRVSDISVKNRRVEKERF